MGLGLIAGAASLISGGLNISASRKRRKAARARRTINKIKNFQSKRKFINDFITAQSTVLARGAISGADLSSSGVQGELASQRTQATTGLIEQREQEKFGDIAASNERKASRLSGAASFIGSAASAIQTIGSEFGGDGTE
jgi:hypothetical protein